MLGNWERIKEYYKAWWNCEVLDKVPIWAAAPRDDHQSRKILSGKGLWIREEEKFSKEKIINHAEKFLQATFYGGVGFPCYWPNFGTDVFSAYMGAELEFSALFPPVLTGPMMIEEGVSPVSWAKWNNVILKDYSDLSTIQIKQDNIYWQKTKEFVSYALERSQADYIVGSTDIHPSMDSLAVLRGHPEQLCLDLIEDPEGVKKAMKLLWEAWLKTYEETYYQIAAQQQEGTSAWINLWAPGKSYPVQDDLTLMISPAHYEEFFLEELVNEINYLDCSIYHLDGPDALQHLNMILDIPSLNAVQWVAGAAENEQGVRKWIPIYKKIQAKSKAVIVYCQPDEIDFVIENLDPKGLMISVSFSSEKEARNLLSEKGWVK